MKKIVLPVMMLVASTVMTVSCKKKKDDDYTPDKTFFTINLKQPISVVNPLYRLRLVQRLYEPFRPLVCTEIPQ